MTSRARAAIFAIALLWLTLLMVGCGSESEVVSSPLSSEGGCDLAAGSVLLVGVSRPCSARCHGSYAKVLVREDGGVLVGPLEERKWR
ncbi:MAG: hypothetical protein IPN34_12130 [Planctomycetes bacterium]|nr:hypothetical protein [Planctomycetota bacterium]